MGSHITTDNQYVKHWLSVISNDFRTTNLFANMFTIDNLPCWTAALIVLIIAFFTTRLGFLKWIFIARRAVFIELRIVLKKGLEYHPNKPQIVLRDYFKQRNKIDKPHEFWLTVFNKQPKRLIYFLCNRQTISYKEILNESI